MAQFGSGRSIIAQNQSAVADSNGNLIVSPDDSWTGSPLGIAARNQVTIGVPNGTFNLLPADPVGDITAANPLPYWDWAPDDGFSAAMAYDTTTQTNSVEIDPTAVGTALGTAILKTRIPITNDEGLDIRQYVSSSLIQVAKAAGTDKWTATLTSQYYDTTGAAIGTPYVIGTIGERGTVTNLASYTNASGAISTSAAELELAYTVVVGTASPTYALQIKSVMVATEYGVIGGGGGGGTGFIPLSVITAAGDLIVGAAAGSAIRLGKGTANQVLTVKGTATGGLSWQDLPPDPTYVPGWTGTTFTTSGTFTVPAGVNYVNVIAVGAGQGGGGGGNSIGRSASAQTATGGAGGATGYYALARDIYVGNVASVSVGIGAGGNGGTAFAFNKAAAATNTDSNNATTGASGGDTTFGTYFTVPGARTAPTGFFDIAGAAGAAGGQGGGVTGGNGSIGGTHVIGSTNNGAPFITFWAGGVAGGTASGSGGTGSSGNGGAAGTALAIAGGGGGGGGGSATATAPVGSAAGAGGVGGPGGGASGGGAAARYGTATVTIVATGAAGANAAANTGAGGGGGGACVVSFAGTATYVPSTLTTTSGAGGNGGSGVLYVYWLKNV